MHVILGTIVSLCLSVLLFLIGPRKLERFSRKAVDTGYLRLGCEGKTLTAIKALTENRYGFGVNVRDTREVNAIYFSPLYF